MTFARELRVEIDATKHDLNQVWQRSVAQTFQQVVTMTPVDTGAARASWLAAITPDNAIGTRRQTFTPQDVPKVGGKFTLYSNLPYMERLENGWSQQASSGMVKVAVANWPAIVRGNTR